MFEAIRALVSSHRALVSSHCLSPQPSITHSSLAQLWGCHFPGSLLLPVEWRRGSWSWGSAVKACNSPPNICLHSPFLSFHPRESLWITYLLSISEMNADLAFPYSTYPSKPNIFFKIFSLKWLFFLLWIREQLLTMGLKCQWHLGVLFVLQFCLW